MDSLHSICCHHLVHIQVVVSRVTEGLKRSDFICLIFFSMLKVINARLMVSRLVRPSVGRSCLSPAARKLFFSAVNNARNITMEPDPELLFSPRLVDEYDFVNDSYTWPLLTYLISCCVYPFISAFAHCFDCVSARARYNLR